MISVRQTIRKTIASRGDATGCVVLTKKSRIGIAFHSLDELDGNGEYQIVNELQQEFPGEPDTVSVFRWPLGTEDPRIAPDLEREIENILQSVTSNPAAPKPAVPARYCWGHLGGEARDDDFVNEVSARLSRAKERIEAELDTTQPLPVMLLMTLHHHGDGIEWGLSVTVDPRKLWILSERDHLPHLINNAWNAHVQQYDGPPKAMLTAVFGTPLPLRTVVERFTAAAINLTAWSRPYQDHGQQCNWLF
jgi:hypothetical protein